MPTGMGGTDALVLTDWRSLTRTGYNLAAADRLPGIGHLDREGGRCLNGWENRRYFRYRVPGQ
jgi:hypothetical protein